MKNILVVITLILGLLWTSCTEPIDLNLNTGDNQKLVVDAWLRNADRPQVINLSISTDYFDEETPTEATGAIITVSSERKTYTFTETEAGTYIMDQRFDGKPGETFTLNVDYQSKTYTATQQMNRIAELTDIDYVLYAEYEEENVNPNNPDNLDEWDVYATFQEPIGTGDYYYFGSFEKSKGPQSNLTLGEYYEDSLLDGAFIESEYVTYGFYEPGDTIITQMFSISEEVHDYLIAIDQQTDFRGFIFDAPPANVPTNISNDGKGFFIISAVSEFEKILEE